MNDDNWRLKTIVVDEKSEDKDFLCSLLKKIPEIEIVASFNDTLEAKDGILLYKPDLIFIGIQMPKKNGLDLVFDLKQSGFHFNVIFVSTHDKYAINAIKLSAIDYLLKPVDFAELSNTVNKAKYKISLESINNKIDTVVNSHKNSLVRFNCSKEVLFLDPSEITFCEANGAYTRIYYKKNKSELVSVSLNHVYKMLSEYNFCRASRYQIFNLKYIIRVNRKTRMALLLKDDEEINIQISRDKLKSILGKY